jgi:hypothetical protein
MADITTGYFFAENFFSGYVGNTDFCSSSWGQFTCEGYGGSACTDDQFDGSGSIYCGTDSTSVYSFAGTGADSTYTIGLNSDTVFATDINRYASYFYGLDSTGSQMTMTDGYALTFKMHFTDVMSNISLTSGSDCIQLVFAGDSNIQLSLYPSDGTLFFFLNGSSSNGDNDGTMTVEDGVDYYVAVVVSSDLTQTIYVMNESSGELKTVTGSDKFVSSDYTQIGAVIWTDLDASQGQSSITYSDVAYQSASDSSAVVSCFNSSRRLGAQRPQNGHHGHQGQHGGHQGGDSQADEDDAEESTDGETLYQCVWYSKPSYSAALEAEWEKNQTNYCNKSESNCETCVGNGETDAYWGTMSNGSITWVEIDASSTGTTTAAQTTTTAATTSGNTCKASNGSRRLSRRFSPLLI